ncbi:6965_t:CDS:2 [Funneliformis geosporum]|uniref:15444_t:CDS:1 n=1 Tax=Funneliformis geosporum TaxID=1117311 RepID=A0A9W4SYD8_9GLOM|nr:15444_t:CDS:2 [Funneliformis geosporum]CAI2186141.1 6965_t:CDS:2 [Funneliformis geosporum]
MVRVELISQAKNEFLKRYDKKVPFSCVIEGLVDDKEVLVAFVDQSEGIPVHLPAELESFPMLISYEALELYHRSYHKDLISGISISKQDEPLNAITLGLLFQNTAVSNKTFILTAKHGVGKEDGKVVQPGTLDEKVGRTTFFREGLIQDMWMPFYPPIVKRKGKKKPKEIKAERGDSGAPVFDNDGKLWGIVIAGVSKASYIIPIHLILDNVKEKFDVTFTLKKEKEPEKKELEEP